MKIVTITLDEETAAWARIRAAHQGTSLSRMIGTLLRRQMREANEYDDAMRNLRPGPFANEAWDDVRALTAWRPQPLARRSCNPRATPSGATV